MASSRIHEDQENRSIPKMRFKQANMAPVQQKRAVLGALQKQPDRSHNLFKRKEPFGSSSQPTAVSSKPVPNPASPLVPVARFEAFKVYEDPNKNEPPMRLRHGKLKESAKGIPFAPQATTGTGGSATTIDLTVGTPTAPSGVNFGTSTAPAPLTFDISATSPTPGTSTAASGGLSSGTPLEYVRGKRGAYHLVVDSNIFNKRNKNTGNQYWYCQFEKTQYQCTSRCITHKGKMLEKPSPHTEHPSTI